MFQPKTYAEALAKVNSRKLRKPLQRAKNKRRRVKKPKLATISSLEKKVWVLCKLLIRKYWCDPMHNAQCFTCDKLLTSYTEMHTGHWRKKSILPMSHKYDLRMLKIQCPGCNLFHNGNEAEYTVRLMRRYGEDWVHELDKEWKEAKQHLKGSAENREFLVNLINDYQKELARTV